MPKTNDEEEIKLAPINEDDETKYEQAMRETYNVTGALLRQTEVPPEPAEEAKIDEKQLTVRIIKYLRQMANGELDEAQSTADKIVPYRGQAKAIFESMLQSDRPEPELANVPHKVLAGFIRNMLARIK
jgi:hypothetical protein